jgi:hypothetical protein
MSDFSRFSGNQKPENRKSKARPRRTSGSRQRVSIKTKTLEAWMCRAKTKTMKTNQDVAAGRRYDFWQRSGTKPKQPRRGRSIQKSPTEKDRLYSSRITATMANKCTQHLRCLHFASILGVVTNAPPPNPSLKRSANGMSRWPSSAGPTAHFALAVQHATPSSPA